jgi:hypothetical protein
LDDWIGGGAEGTADAVGGAFADKWDPLEDARHLLAQVRKPDPAVADQASGAREFRQSLVEP